LRSILVIGGPGMLGRPVVRRLVEEGLYVRVLARKPEEAAKLLPNKVDIVPGNVKVIDSIRKASVGVEVVYINLATTNPKEIFRAEYHGTLNVLKALKGDKDTVIAKLTGLSALQDKMFPDIEDKIRADEAIKESGNPYLLFPASWFMESLPLFINQGKLTIFGKQPHPVHWISADDYGKMLAIAVRKGYTNKVFPVQGSNPMTFDEAAHKFVETFDKNIEIIHKPMWMLRMAGMFKPQLASIYHLMNHYNKYPEIVYPDEPWKVLYKPQMTIEDYVKYMKNTGDVPSKRS